MICGKPAPLDSAKLQLSAAEAGLWAPLAGGGSMKARLHELIQTWLQVLGLSEAPRLEPVRVLSAEEQRRRQRQRQRR